uniref:Uncharacterized protein n=1 Tax=Romanomermis culicivorax TaxID=13658 RepID=A0A915KUK4_ROMCU
MYDNQHPPNRKGGPYRPCVKATVTVFAHRVVASLPPTAQPCIACCDCSSAHDKYPDEEHKVGHMRRIIYGNGAKYRLSDTMTTFSKRFLPKPSTGTLLLIITSSNVSPIFPFVVNFTPSGKTNVTFTLESS